MQDFVNGIVVCNTASLKKQNKEVFKLTEDEDTFKDKIYALDTVLKENSSLHLRGRIINIVPNKTFSTIEKDRAGNYDVVLEELKTATRNVKRFLKLPLAESFIETIEDDPAILEDAFIAQSGKYLIWLEKTVIALSKYNKPDISDAVLVDQDEELLKALKEEAKGLGISIKGKNTVESLEKKILEKKEELEAEQEGQRFSQ